MNEYTASTECFDYDAPAVASFIETTINGISDTRQALIALYYAVRDQILYYPYELQLHAHAFTGSTILEKQRGHCIGKAALFISCSRAIGIPARLGLAKVINHIGVSRLTEIFDVSVLAPHGYAEVFIDDHWVKLTPIFNMELCKKLGVPTLEFDGFNDALFQQFDTTGRLFMQYVEDYGTFDHVPILRIMEILKEEYPHLFVGFDEAHRVQGVDLVKHYNNRVNPINID